MDWSAVSAIGTIIAAIVGIAGIWLNLWEKKRKLDVRFEMIPTFKIVICNNSTRTVKITAMTCFVGTHLFYAQYFDENHDVLICPATIDTIQLDKQKIHESYFQHQIDALCDSNEKIVIVLSDNYGRKYRIKTNFGIGLFSN